MADHPNVLFIMADQHHAGRLGCCGDPLVATPNHDFIAREGVRFSSAYANSPICGPSRTCFFSGRYVHQHGVFGNCGTNPSRSRWMTEHFRENGYTTAGVGKMHMGCEWLQSQMDYVRNENLFDAPADDPLGPWGAHYYRYLLECGVWEKSGFFYDPEAPVVDYPVMCRTWELPEEHSPEAWIGREALHYLRNRDRSRPFFLHVSFPRPHDPLSVPAPFDSMYDPDDVTLPPNHTDDLKDKSPWIRESYERQRRHGYPYAPDDINDLRRAEAHYYGLISLNDKQIGLILDELRAQDVLDDTIVVFAADHGDFAGEHGMHFKNLGIYEAIHRIPLMVRYPRRIGGGTVFDGVVESVDLHPTLCDLAGLPIPDDIAGQTVMPPLARETSWPKATAFCEARFFGHELVGVRNAEARLLYSPDADACELYDLQADPWEMHNAWDDPDHRDLRERMCEAATNWFIRTEERQEGPPMHSADTFSGAMIRGVPVKELRKRFAASWSDFVR